MASDLKIGTSARNAAANAITALLNGGSDLVVFDDGEGSGVPASPADPHQATAILWTTTFAATAFGSAVTGSATANAIASALVQKAGDALYFRAISTGGVCVFQGLVDVAANAPNDLELNTISLVLQGTLTIGSMVLSVAE